ncbi:MAG: glutamine synthetase, partial [Mycolicibacterium sp.]|nr:glutamine synthetase [Mycolicibacterium sp.]
MPVGEAGDGQVSIEDRIEELRGHGVELVVGSVTDPAGVTRGKYVPLRRLGD